MGQLGIGAVAYRTLPAQVFFEGDSSINLLSPETGKVCQACSLVKGALPQFSWEATEPFSKYTLLFSAPSTGVENPFVKKTVKVRDFLGFLQIWKKILNPATTTGVPR